MTKKKIIIVDDHEIFRKGLRLIISKFDHSVIVAEATNGQDFLDLLPSTECDLVLMDIQMPEMNGIDATKKALEIKPNLNIVALSMYGEEKYLESMLEAGAKGFLLKNIDKDKLYKAIDVTSSGNNYFSDELLTFFTKKYLSKPKNSELEPKLTERELEVLTLIAKGKTDKEIADALFISERTVNGHRANLISKTGSKNTVNLLVYSIKNKLIDLDKIS
ncbi:MAG: DNA-binding response regulator [Bacteroidetes bacterium RIFOXYA12_FULL_35_11]|nr:MAG: DNA-binding response regulator [Bacteroidetes bacterium GWF2_35_48]OFY72683.1 MAG: DNA-binding response regulator [Bacteroidetes bacterium RIFOXYA12_FULL_35_11]OFY92614.1 MAG: DNA-binding response regulator [Bacteroidetes bacterium RIFOXYC12_FULL_35_7]HBX50994.1 DNA-binding response regulator [Bacteroidales bacterium]